MGANQYARNWFVTIVSDMFVYPIPPQQIHFRGLGQDFRPWEAGPGVHEAMMMSFCPPFPYHRWTVIPKILRRTSAWPKEH